PLFAESEILELHQYRDGEAVIDRSVFDIGRFHARLFESARPRPYRAGIGQIDVAAHLVLGRLTGADDLHLGALELFRDLRADDDDGAATIADDAAIETVQGIGDHRRIDDILDRDDVAQHRMRIVLRVMRSRDLDPSELLAGRAVLVHVPH